MMRHLMKEQNVFVIPLWSFALLPSDTFASAQMSNLHTYSVGQWWWSFTSVLCTPPPPSKNNKRNESIYCRNKKFIFASSFYGLTSSTFIQSVLCFSLWFAAPLLWYEWMSRWRRRRLEWALVQAGRQASQVIRSNKRCGTRFFLWRRWRI